MEIFELRYFLGVARHENLHRASEELSVSPGSLSKAIARIEGELGVKLFHREGRNIRLTDHGKLLKLRAGRIVELEQSARAELAGDAQGFQAVLAGPEVLLSRFGLELAQRVERRHPGARFEFRATSDESALEQVSLGDAHLAVVTADPPRGLASKLLGETSFVTVAGPGHPLHSAARARRPVPVEEVLTHPFASPAHALLGQVGRKQSTDGWRDDQFQRRISYVASSLKVLENLVTSGRALAYLPDYLAESLGLGAIKVTGCPYSCSQKIRLVARKPEETGWIHQLF